MKQIYDIKDKAKKREMRVDPYDRLTAMMVAESNSSSKQRFIQRITQTADNHCVSLFTEDVVQTVLRTCGNNSVNKSPIHIDTTYNLTSSFAVICTIRATEFEGNPLMVGPILLTNRERAEDITILWDNLISKCPQLRQQCLAFVTDGDHAIINSLKASFPSSFYFRCMLHLSENVRRKMSEIGLNSKLVKMIMIDMKDLQQLDSHSFDEVMQKTCGLASSGWSTG